MTKPVCPRVVFILGPTASGKSAVAESLARAFAGEIVSVDSAQVYRGLDIGTAKPGAAIRAEIPHHLIDLVPPTEAYSAARFCDDARTAIAAIAARGRVPIVAGGTMLYVHALLHGMDRLPAADPAIRAALRAQAEVEGWPALHAELARVDPVSAARLAPLDQQRIERALEVFRATGQPISAFHAGARVPPPFDPLLLALVPSDRAALHARIAARFRGMVAAGLLEELRGLQCDYPGLHAELPAMRAVGYRQAWDHLAGELDADEWVQRGIFATRQLAKRQLTWLRGMDGLRVVDALAEDVSARCRHEASAFLESASD